MAVGQSNSRWDAPGAIDVINTFYGRPDIPIGQVKYKTHEGGQYSSFLVKNYEYDLDLDNVPSAVQVYRQVLASAPDKSVKFVVIGFKSNMRDLLQSKPNEEYQAGFDLAALLVAVRGADRYFNTKSGCNVIDNQGGNRFVYNRDCGHRHVDSQNRKVRYEEIGAMFEEMMLSGPKNPAQTRRVSQD